jgi:DNA adenine methylase
LTKADNNFVRSPFFYVGDKYKLLTQILPLFPKKFDRYFEPFVGGGSVFLNCEAKQVFINDIDESVIDIHNLLLSHRDNPKLFFDAILKLIKKYELTNTSAGYVVPADVKKAFPKTYFAKINKTGFDLLKEKYNKSKDRSVFELYVLMIYGFNRMLRFNKSNNYNIPVGNVDFNNNVKSALGAYFTNTEKREIVTTSTSFKEFLKLYRPKKNDFVYLDPPYLITGSEYNKLWSASDEKELYMTLDKLDSSGVLFALSNVVIYGELHNEILEEWMAKYKVEVISSNYINYFNNGKKVITEVLVRNYA